MLSKKIFSLLFLVYMAALIVQTSLSLAIISTSAQVQAQNCCSSDDESEKCEGLPVCFEPNVSIGEDFTSDTAYEMPKGTEGIALYVSAIYKYAIAVVGVLAVVIMMFGGATWITSGGNSERVTEAKAWIAASLTGLILVLCSWIILKTINPALVDFNTPELKTVDKALEAESAASSVQSCIAEGASCDGSIPCCSPNQCLGNPGGGNICTL